MPNTNFPGAKTLSARLAELFSGMNIEFSSGKYFFDVEINLASFPDHGLDMTRLLARLNLRDKETLCQAGVVQAQGGRIYPIQ